MVDINRLEFFADIRDGVSGTMGKISKNVKKSSSSIVKSLAKIEKPTLVLSQRFGNLRLASLSVAGALAGVGAIAFQRSIVASINRLEGFQKQMNVVRAITESTAQEFKALENFALELGRTTIFSASQASEAMTNLSRSGKDAGEIFAILPTILNTAAAGQLSLANASRIVQNVLAVSNLAATEAVKVGDLLAATSSRSRTTIDGLGKSFELLAGTQRDVNLTLEETSALLAIVGERGIVGSRAGTSLASAFSSLVKPTKAAQEVLAQLGVSTLDASGNIRNFIDFMRDLERANISATEKAILFEKRGLRAVNALLTEGIGNLRLFTKGLQDVGGEAERLAKQFQIGLPGAFNRTASALDVVLIRFGKIFEPAVIAGLTAVTGNINDLSASIERLVGISSKVLGFTGSLLKGFVRLKTGVLVVIEVFKILKQEVIIAFDAILLTLEAFLVIFATAIPKVLLFVIDKVQSVFIKGFSFAFEQVLDGLALLLDKFNFGGIFDDAIDQLFGFSKSIESTLVKATANSSEALGKLDKAVEAGVAGVFENIGFSAETIIGEIGKSSELIKDSIDDISRITKGAGEEIADIEMNIASITEDLKVAATVLANVNTQGLGAAADALSGRFGAPPPEKPDLTPLTPSAADPKGLFAGIQSPFIGIAAGLSGFTQESNETLDAFTERFGESAELIALQAQGMQDSITEASAAIVGAFIDQAIAGEFSAKALTAAALKAVSGVLKAVAIEATVKGFLALAEGLAGDKTKFAAAAGFFKTAALAGAGAIAAGVAGAALTPSEEERTPSGDTRGQFGDVEGRRRFETPVAEQQQRGGGEINITVFGFVGNEQELGSALGPIIRQATNDDVDFGANVELA